MITFIWSTESKPGAWPAYVTCALTPLIMTVTAFGAFGLSPLVFLNPVKNITRKVGEEADPTGIGLSLPLGLTRGRYVIPSLVHTAAAVPCPVELNEKMPGDERTMLTRPPITDPPEFV